MKYNTQVASELVRENKFIRREPTSVTVPTFKDSKDLLPIPIWEGHEDAINCYWKAWELAFSNLHNPTDSNQFISPFIDTAFNNCIFLWDSVFMLFFGRYGIRAFHFQGTLDNFYSKQHEDGFICREISIEDGEERFEKFDNSSTGPNVLPWSEWEYYQSSGDKDRLSAVFPVLLAYYRWYRTFRSWPDGSYFSNGWGSGMDNVPRSEDSDFHHYWSHGHLSWIDITLQQIFAARLLEEMASALGRSDEIVDVSSERNTLVSLVQQEMWNDKSSFFYDRYRDGSLSSAKHIGAFWALLADAVPENALARFLDHLRDESSFCRPHRIPSLSADHELYDSHGNYWQGSVWAPTNYMVLRGLTQVGEDDLAYEIGRNHHENVLKVYKETDTLWENYAPDGMSGGDPSKSDFVGWTGLVPISILFEYVFGIRLAVDENEIIWNVNLIEKHGIKQLPFGAKGVCDLICEERSSVDEEPQVTIQSKLPITVRVLWDGREQIVNSHG